MDHNDWLASLPGSPTRKDLAARVGVDPATLYRQIERGGLKMETVRDISRVCGASAVSELIRTGHLTPDDLSGADIQAALKQATVTDLIDELWERAHQGEEIDHLNPSGDNIADLHPLPEFHLDIYEGEPLVADSSREEAFEADAAYAAASHDVGYDLEDPHGFDQDIYQEDPSED